MGGLIIGSNRTSTPLAMRVASSSSGMMGSSVIHAPWEKVGG
jgi:hypothetical protein